MRLFTRRGLGGLVLMGGVLAHATARAAEPVKIRIGWSAMPGHMIPVLFSKPEVLRHYGKSYTVEPVSFRGSSPQLTAFAAGEIDLMASSSGTLDLAVVNAHMDPKVIADFFQEGVPGYHSEAFVVLADSGITSPGQLKGKRVASNAIGSAADSGMRAVLAKSGLRSRDFTTIQAAFPSMLALLDEKKVDVAPIQQPVYKSIETNPKYRTLFTVADGLGHTDSVFLIAQSAFLTKNHDAVQDFVEDFVRTMRWFKDPANRTEAQSIVGAYMKIPPSELSHLFTKDDYYRDPFQKPYLAGIQNTINQLKDLDLVPKTIQVEPDYADLSFIEEATRRVQQQT